jgi:hypothetical protein
LNTLQQAARAFRQTPGRTGHVVRLPPGAEVLVVGDMHGNVENFRLLLKAADLARQPQRHLVMQEVVHGLFRYPEGGDKSHQLLDVVAALKCQFPERMHFLLGNHELAQWQNHRIAKGDDDQNLLFRAGLEHAYGDWADAIVGGYHELFAAADLAVVTANRVFLSHSLPSAKHLSNFNLAILERDEFEPTDLQLGGAVHALVWGRDVTRKNVESFLQKVDADWLITGHIPCEQGFMVPNERQIILDALGTPACYCLFPTDVPLTQQALVERIGTL